MHTLQDTVVEILTTAATQRTSLNQAANLIEDASAGGREISAKEVMLAIRAWLATVTDEPAGGYWRVCTKAAIRVERAGLLNRLLNPTP